MIGCTIIRIIYNSNKNENLIKIRDLIMITKKILLDILVFSISSILFTNISAFTNTSSSIQEPVIGIYCGSIFDSKYQADRFNQAFGTNLTSITYKSDICNNGCCPIYIPNKPSKINTFPYRSLLPNTNFAGPDEVKKIKNIIIEMTEEGKQNDKKILLYGKGTGAATLIIAICELWSEYDIRENLVNNISGIVLESPIYTINDAISLVPQLKIIGINLGRINKKFIFGQYQFNQKSPLQAIEEVTLKINLFTFLKALIGNTTANKQIKTSLTSLQFDNHTFPPIILIAPELHKKDYGFEGIGSPIYVKSAQKLYKDLKQTFNKVFYIKTISDPNNFFSTIPSMDDIWKQIQSIINT